jgi:hypothetical protein
MPETRGRDTGNLLIKVSGEPDALKGASPVRFTAGCGFDPCFPCIKRLECSTFKTLYFAHAAFTPPIYVVRQKTYRHTPIYKYFTQIVRQKPKILKFILTFHLHNAYNRTSVSYEFF